MRFLFISLVSFLCLFAGGCNVDTSEFSAKILGPNIISELEAYNQAAIDKNDSLLFAKAHPELEKAITDEVKKQVFDSITGERIVAQKLLTANKSVNASYKNGKITSYEASYEVQTEERFHLFRYGLLDVGDGPLLTQFYVNQNDVSFEKVNAFNSVEKTPLRVIFISAMVIVLCFIVFTVYCCARTKGLKRKWLWIIFILFGIHGLNLNWTTGEISQTFFSYDAVTQNFNFSLVQFNLLGASATKASVLSPWVISVFFPLGAVVFWLKHSKTFNNNGQKATLSETNLD